MFELTKVKAKLSKFNPRTEIHGQEGKLAGDIKFDANLAAADVLPYFDPALRSLLFCKREGVVQDLANQASDAPNLRYPQMGMPLKWAMEIVGAELAIDHGLGGKSDLVLEGCKVNSFELEPKEGGTVLVSFRVQTAADLDSKVAGALCLLNQRDVEITLTPPSAEASLLDKAA